MSNSYDDIQEVVRDLMRDALKYGLDSISAKLDDKDLIEAAENYAKHMMAVGYVIEKASWEVSLNAILLRYRREEQEKIMAKIKEYWWTTAFPFFVAFIKGLI